MGTWPFSIAPTSARSRICPRAASSEGYWYARLGYGSLFADSAHSGGSFGFGYRAAFEQLGLGFSFLNFQLNDSGGYYGASSSAWTLIKLEGLYFLNQTGNRSAYFGGGLSYGRTEVPHSTTGDYRGAATAPGCRGA